MVGFLVIRRKASSDFQAFVAMYVRHEAPATVMAIQPMLIVVFELFMGSGAGAPVGCGAEPREENFTFLASKTTVLDLYLTRKHKLSN